jgi:DNA excision repair protein ERCC-2
MPFEFYRDTLGMAARTATLDVPSPFKAEQIEVHIADRLSGRARHRQQALPALVRAVRKRFAQCPGNYLVFVGSLAYAQAFASALQRAAPQVPQWVQTPAMDPAEREAFLQRFTEGGHGVGVAVLGGAFGEGVDLPGERLVGVFIVGLGLAPPDALNERMCARLEERFGQGYAYTYLYPGLQKVVQAAGRLIRTEADRGALFLMDDRFNRPEIQALLPAWWGVNPANSCA